MYLSLEVRFCCIILDHGDVHIILHASHIMALLPSVNISNLQITLAKILQKCNY